MPTPLVVLICVSAALSAATLVSWLRSRRRPSEAGVALFLGIGAFCVGAWTLVVLASFVLYTTTA